jgi:hypothetical protein
VAEYVSVVEKAALDVSVVTQFVKENYWVMHEPAYNTRGMLVTFLINGLEVFKMCPHF